MANISARQRSIPITYSPSQSLCVIVGLACLLGYILDITILALPPEPFNVQWRIGLLQQAGDRSIVLMFSSALMMYGFLSNKALRKWIALACLTMGAMFTLSGVVMVHDSLKLQDMTVTNIAVQESQVRSQIQSAQDNPQDLAPEVTPELLEQATQELSRQARSAKQTAKTGLIKVGASSVGNLIVTGFALIAIGRLGTRLVG